MLLKGYHKNGNQANKNADLVLNEIELKKNVNKINPEQIYPFRVLFVIILNKVLSKYEHKKYRSNQDGFSGITPKSTWKALGVSG